MHEPYTHTDIDRLKRLTNISEKDIGKRIMYCQECLFQGKPGEVMNSFCPDCKNRQHEVRLMYVVISKELIDIIHQEVPIKKTLSIKEFREKGYLQELNRTFLHPLGLALTVQIENGEETFSQIWDSRDDPEGIYYDLKNSKPNRLASFRQKERFVKDQLNLKNSVRILQIGSVIEKIPKL